MHISLDSRLIRPGDYFVPVVGDTSDGHKYIDAALKNGAVGVIEVDDLYTIAKEKLQKINPKIIAITGSVGKSTTKEYVLQLLGVKFRTCDGYLNTKLGLASNIINEMNDDCEVFVAECGMDRKGELLETGTFLNPHIVVLTNISESHMEKLGTIESIIEAKSELIRSVREDGIGFFNETNQHVVEVSKKYPPSKVIYYGNDINELINQNASDLPEHNKGNLGGAYKIAKHLGVSDVELLPAIKNISTPKGRLNRLVGINDSTIIDDTYNASPVSTIAALNFFSEYAIKNSMRKIAVLGGMLELGTEEDVGHQKVGDVIAELNCDLLVLAGELSKKYLLSDKLRHSAIQIVESIDSTDAGNYLLNNANIQKNDVILVKGSQGIRMEKTISLILKDPARAKDLLVRQDVRWS